MRSHLALVALASLALAGCASQAPPAPEETLVGPPAPSTSPVEESFELGPIPPDVTLVIKASARAADGEALSLELRVRRPVPFDDVANQTVPAAAIQSKKNHMLILSRKAGEKLVIGDNIVVEVVRIQGNRITLGIAAPSNVKILRSELEQHAQSTAKLEQADLDVLLQFAS